MRPSLLVLLLTGCATAPQPTSAMAPPATATTPAAPVASPPPAPRYAAVFDELVKRIERDHTFPPRYARDVGHPWSEDLPRLRDEFVRAGSRQEALIALRHLQNSLRDAHCELQPPADLHERWLRIGLRIWTGGTPASPEVRVTEVLDPELKGRIAPGDAVVSIDGAPLPAWLAAHPFETNMLSPAAALAETASQLVYAPLPWSTAKEGDARVLGIVHDGKPGEVSLRFRRSFPEADGPDLDHPPPMAKVDCDVMSPPPYGDYALTAMGVNVCVYRPARPAQPRVAVVRFLSFYYAGIDSAQSLRMVKADHDVLSRALRDVDGVVLDVHENHGGNNPFIFMGWFSGGPWDHERVVTRVVPGLDAASVSELFWGDERNVSAYAEAQKTGGRTVESRFLCMSGTCVGETAPAVERVTRAPVALVVGPDCMSSCDTLALTWSAARLGPIVGKQPMHAYTVNRLPIHVSGPESEDLGTMRIALSESELEPGVSIEGEPLHLEWEAPDTFDTRKTWVRDAIEQAKRRLRR